MLSEPVATGVIVDTRSIGNPPSVAVYQADDGPHRIDNEQLGSEQPQHFAPEDPEHDGVAQLREFVAEADEERLANDNQE